MKETIVDIEISVGMDLDSCIPCFNFSLILCTCQFYLDVVIAFGGTKFGWIAFGISNFLFPNMFPRTSNCISSNS